ncbi:MAG: ATP synthase F1 subunit epsilon [Candidatus Lokiarchaeota archaeon]|nr:ATP synthase F1 subunit epsilon [Candidatus Lokiarchaeota archaeon]
MKIKIISATKELYSSDQIKSVLLPGSLGQMQLLPGHANLLSKLEIGEVVVETQKGTKENFVLNGGFVVNREDNIVILADDAAKREDLVEKEIEESINQAKAKIDKDLPPSEIIQLEKQLRYERFKKDKLSK